MIVHTDKIVEDDSSVEPPSAVEVKVIGYYPATDVSNVADLHAVEVSLVGGHKGYVIPEIIIVTIYALMGQLLSPVVKSLIL